jgi:hypothetical protein
MRRWPLLGSICLLACAPPPPGAGPSVLPPASFDASGADPSPPASDAAAATDALASSGPADADAIADTPAQADSAAASDVAGTKDGGSDGGDGKAEWWASIPSCKALCTTAADCGQPAAGAYDADNYACEKGTCVYKGCLSDAECQQSWGSKANVCAALLAGVKWCAPACTKVADCAGASPAFDADNYTCSKGACVYTGCNSDAECATVGPQLVCSKAWGSSMAFCLPACKTATDCAQPRPYFDASHYACDDGLCRYLGCASDAECTQRQQQPAVCN